MTGLERQILDAVYSALDHALKLLGDDDVALVDQDQPQSWLAAASVMTGGLLRGDPVLIVVPVPDFPPAPDNPGDETP